MKDKTEEGNSYKVDSETVYLFYTENDLGNTLYYVFKDINACVDFNYHYKFQKNIHTSAIETAILMNTSKSAEEESSTEEDNSVVKVNFGKKEEY